MNSINSIGVIGLGYVGREVASLALARGFDVHAVDMDEAVIDAVESAPEFVATPGSLHTTTNCQEIVPECQIIIIAVPTPLSSSRNVDLGSLQSVCQEIAEVHDSDEPLAIIVESTIPPGTISEVVAPIFGEEGIDSKSTLFAHAPERVDPGNQEWSLESIPRVVGGLTPDATEVATRFYNRLLDAEVHEVSSPSVAAASKIIENAYRDINIAFVNEIALTLDKLDIDVEDVLDAAATKPFGFTRFEPGAGVGGHCIPIDPYFLIEKADNNGFNSRFLKSAREINDRMPKYVANKTIDSLVRLGKLPQDAEVLLLGKAFKPGVDDTRNSPYYAIRSELEDYRMSLETYDPQLPEDSTVDSVYQAVSALVLVTPHPEFRDINFEKLAAEGVKLLVDGRNIFDPSAVEETGIKYVGVGRS